MTNFDWFCWLLTFFFFFLLVIKQMSVSKGISINLLSFKGILGTLAPFPTRLELPRMFVGQRVRDTPNRSQPTALLNCHRYANQWSPKSRTKQHRRKSSRRRGYPPGYGLVATEKHLHESQYPHNFFFEKTWISKTIKSNPIPFVSELSNDLFSLLAFARLGNRISVFGISNSSISFYKYVRDRNSCSVNFQVSDAFKLSDRNFNTQILSFLRISLIYCFLLWICNFIIFRSD